MSLLHLFHHRSSWGDWTTTVTLYSPPIMPLFTQLHQFLLSCYYCRVTPSRGTQPYINDLSACIVILSGYLMCGCAAQRCNCSGLPQCYVCNSTSAENCRKEKQLVTCPNYDVCIWRWPCYCWLGDGVAECDSMGDKQHTAQRSSTRLLFWWF